MRRPVKPFVTEYKGNSRRAASPAGLSLKLDDDAASASARPAASRSDGARQSEGARHAEHQRFGGGPQTEDSYEAAMRAADALFSNAPGRTSEEPSAQGVVSDDRRLETNAQERETSGATGAASAGSTGGRILRVIDEAPPQAVVDLEVERTPKRRGRKPGSKNKPKLAPRFVEAPAATRARLETRGAPVAASPTHDGAARQAPGGASARAPSSGSVSPISDAFVARPAQAPRPAAPAQRPRVDPYGWVRTKLKPGERWKRRLPKVAW